MHPLSRFTIVTPSFNQAQFLPATIQSVLSQEGDFEIEYFVMDGGSTDGSVDTIRDYADRVRSRTWPARCRGVAMDWVSRPDKGQSDAINQGLRRATGTVASYINSDDLYCPGAFARVLKEFQEHPEADFVYGDGDVIDAAGQRQWEWLSRPYDHEVMTSYHFQWNDFTNYILQQATFWRTCVHDRIGLFDQQLHYAMDAEYWIRAGAAGLHLRHVPFKLGQFRMIEGTKSLSSPTAFWADQLEIFRRYLRPYRLDRKFAYYYYNLARHGDFDLELAREEGTRTLERWRDLPTDEWRMLEHRARRGFRQACLLVAVDLLRQRREPQAASAFRKALAGAPLIGLHRTALEYLIRRAMGPRASAVLDKLLHARTRRYRRKYVDYRYHESR